MPSTSYQNQPGFLNLPKAQQGNTWNQWRQVGLDVHIHLLLPQSQPSPVMAAPEVGRQSIAQWTYTLEKQLLLQSLSR